jgi:hypothetical protein
MLTYGKCEVKVDNIMMALLAREQRIKINAGDSIPSRHALVVRSDRGRKNEMA